MTQPGTADLTIVASTHDSSDADFLALRATIACRGFSGHTQFVSARRDLRFFINDAEGLATKATDSALLLGGWEKNEQPLRLQIARAGLSGLFVARVRIATNGPRTDQWNRVETEFIAAPNALTAFLHGLGDLAGGSGSPATLTGDADAIE